jgi:hypothetical protein
MPIILMAAMLGYVFYMKNKQKQAMANIGPALHKFYGQTGYRYADMPQAPLEEQVRVGEQRMMAMYNGSATGDIDFHLVRDFHGAPVHFRQSYSRRNNSDGSTTISMGATWFTPLAAPPRAKWEAIDRSLVGFGKAVKEAFSNMTRKLEPMYAHEVPTGDPELDKKVVIYAEDPQAALAALRSPGLREMILRTTEVHLAVTDREVFFADPFQKNMTAAMGGMVGQMSIGFDYGRMFDATIPVHEQMAEIVAVTARASA